MIRRGVVLATVLLIAANVVADERADLERAQALAWAKHFDEAANLYTAILRRHSASHDATLGLARVRLWQGHYSEARELFRRLGNDPNALEGAATAAYWSGDFRTAEREFRALLAEHPNRETARRSLDELRAASPTTERLDIGLVDDDQPFRAARSEARVSVFSDPLTRWDAIAGTYHISSDLSRGGAPFAVAQNETVLPGLHLTATTSIGGIRTPDHETHAIGGFSARFRLLPHDMITAAFVRREIMTTATRLYPFADVTSLRWHHDAPWLASIGVERDHFSDRNSADAFDAYVLVPLRKEQTWTFWAGVSGLARDTAESRFHVTQVSATRDPTGRFFLYTYRGAYDPYWTPQGLREARLIVAIERRTASGMIVKLQADGGSARDRALTFWPDSGPTSFPSEIGSSFFRRRYDPWRVGLSLTRPLAHGFSIDVGYERSVTADYRANTFHASLARRR